MSIKVNSQPVTKQELKEELKRFATKKELKQELKRFATKKELKDGFGKINKKLNTIINFFDHLTINHEERIKRLEQHTGLTPLS